MRSQDYGQGSVVMAEEDTTQRHEIVRYLQENDFRRRVLGMLEEGK